MMGIASRTLREHGMEQKAEEMRSRMKESGSYDAALAVLMDYVNPIGINETQSEMDMEMGM